MYFTFKLKEQLDTSSPSVYNKGGAGAAINSTNTTLMPQPMMQPGLQNTAGCQPTFMQQQAQATQQAALSNMENQAIKNPVAQPVPTLGTAEEAQGVNELMQGMRKISRGGK